MSGIIPSDQIGGDGEITVKDNPKNVITAHPANAISRKPRPVVGLSHGEHSAGDQPLERRCVKLGTPLLQARVMARIKAPIKARFIAKPLSTGKV